jgi:hypothetical protein
MLIDEFISMAKKILEPLSLSYNMSLDRLEHKSVPPSPNIDDRMGEKIRNLSSLGILGMAIILSIMVFEFLILKENMLLKLN